MYEWLNKITGSISIMRTTLPEYKDRNYIQYEVDPKNWTA
jgi:hypothetical protein